MSRRTAAFLLLPAVAVVVILLAVPLLYLLGYGFLDTQYGQDQIEGVTLRALSKGAE